MKILNLHGFMGEADNKNYKALCESIAPENIISPKLIYKQRSPQDILSSLSNMVNSDDFIFIGQSLGGWFADKLSRKFIYPCILTNPCYYPHKLGLITESGISSEYIDKYREMSEHCRNSLAYTLCSDADTILPDNYHDCISLSQNVIRVHGSHGTIDNISEHLAEALNYISADKT